MTLSEILWKQRKEILLKREPKWILKFFWSVPGFAGLVLLAAEGFRLLSIFILVLVTIYVIYSFITYFLWKKWKNDGHDRTRSSILLVMAYDGFSLGIFSFLALAFANLSFRWIDPTWIQWGWILSVTLYIIMSFFLLFSGKRIVIYLIEKHEKPLPPQTKLALTIQGYIVGLGIALGAIFRSSYFGLILGAGLGYLCAFLLMPFSITAFFQVYLMIRME